MLAILALTAVPSHLDQVYICMTGMCVYYMYVHNYICMTGMCVYYVFLHNRVAGTP